MDAGNEEALDTQYPSEQLKVDHTTARPCEDSCGNAGDFLQMHNILAGALNSTSVCSAFDCSSAAYRTSNRPYIYVNIVKARAWQSG